MKALLVFAHPRKESFTHALVHRVTQALVANGAEVTVRDLYKLGFDPVLRGEDTIHIENGKFVREATSFPPDVPRRVRSVRRLLSEAVSRNPGAR